MKKTHNPIATPFAFGEAVALYFSTCGKSNAYWRENERRFSREIVPALGHATVVPAISSEQLAGIISSKRDEGRPEAARIMHGALNRFFKWCQKQGYVSRSPMKDLEPPGQPEKRDRILSPAELNRFWHATFDSPSTGSLYRLLALTLQERGQVAGMRWCDIDLDAKLWMIGAGSGETCRAIPLTQPAIAELQAINRVPDCPYVFGVPGRDGAWSVPDAFGKAKRQLDIAMRPDSGWRLLDLRLTAFAFLSQSGIAPDVTRKLLGHKVQDSRFPVTRGLGTGARPVDGDFYRLRSNTARPGRC